MENKKAMGLLEAACLEVDSMIVENSGNLSGDDWRMHECIGMRRALYMAMTIVNYAGKWSDITLAGYIDDVIH